MATLTTGKSKLRLGFFELVFGMNEGFLCIATIDPATGPLSFSQKFYKWPHEAIKVENYILSVENGHDVYFGVNLLSEMERKKEHCLPTDLLWADLDAVDLDTNEVLNNLPPPILMESSPGRYQGLWRLAETVPPYQAEIYSRRITYACGADKSGWMLTKLLRVPYTTNYKYKSKPTVQMLRSMETRLELYLLELLPKPVSDADNDPDADFLEQPIPKAAATDKALVESIFYKYQLEASKRGLLIEFAREPDEQDDWSKVLWRFIHKCYECGMTPEETFAVSKHAACNKYIRDGRPIEHLWRDCLKAFGNYNNITVITGTHKPLSMPQLVDEPASETFLDRYRDWAKDATDAIEEFHDLCAAILLSSIVSGSVVLNTSYGPQTPNLWGMVLGDSTLSRKTTAMNMAMELLRTFDTEVVIATDGTPEGLLTGLATRPNKASVFFKDEISGFFDSINRKEYLAGMAETLTQLYDVPGIYRRRLRKEIVTIESPAFIFFGGGVRDRVYAALSDEYVVSGFLPRFLVVSGETDLSRLRRTHRPTPQDLSKRAGLKEELANLYECYATEVPIKLGDMPPVMLTPRITADLTDEAWDKYGDIEELMVKLASESPIPDLALPTFERLTRSLLKLSVILASTNQEPVDDKITVQTSDVINAAWYVQNWGRFSVDLILNAGKSINEKAFDKVVSIVNRKPGILRSELMQHHHFSKRDLDEIVANLVERNQIRTEKFGNGTRFFTT